MKRDLPMLAITMNRASRDAESFYARERERIFAEMMESNHPQTKQSRRARRAGEKQSYEARLRKRLKDLSKQ